MQPDDAQESTHPFVQAMMDFLVECGYRANRPPIMQSLMRGTNAKYEADMKIMADLCNERMTPADLSGCQGPDDTLLRPQ